MVAPELAKRSLKETLLDGLNSNKAQARPSTNPSQNLQNLKTGTKSLFEDDKTDRSPNPKQILEGNSNGGGGGAYLLPNGKYATMPEFGILIQDQVSPTTTAGKVYARPPNYCEVSKEVRDEIEKIDLKIRRVIPAFHIQADVIPEARKLICKYDVDPEVYERIKQEYRQVLEAAGYQLDEKKFVLPAISENGVTYLLPDYKKLNDDTQRAKYIIHEAEMRKPTVLNRVQLLTRALKIDTLIQQIAFPNKGETLKILDVLKRLAKLKLINEQNIFHHIMLMLAGEMNQGLPLSSLIENYAGADLWHPVALSPSMIQELQIQHGLKNKYAEMLEGAVIEFAQKSNSRDQTLVSKYCRSNNGPAVEMLVPEPGNRAFPAEKMILMFCMGGGDPNIYVSQIRLKQAGPFLESVAYPQ